MLGPFPPSAEIANGVHVYGNVQQSCLDPMTMAELARDPEYLESLGQLELVAYGGGALSPGVGDPISARTTLLNVLGSTECGRFPVQLCEPEG